MGPFGDTWVLIDGQLVYDSDNAGLGKRGNAYGEVEIEKGFHRLDIYHAYRDNACDPVQSQFAFNFVPNIHDDVDDDEYFHVELYGDDPGEEFCFLNSW